MFRKMPYLLLAISLLALLFDSVIPLSVKSFLYALSLSIKSLIIFILPLLIFMLLFKTLAGLASKATKMVFTVLAFVVCSNFIATLLSYPIGSALFHVDLSIASPKESDGLLPLFAFSMPKWVANDHALFGGLIFGIALTFFKPLLAGRIASVFEKIIEKILFLLTYAIPLFITGFIIKLVHDKVLQGMVQNYAWILLLVALAQFSYIAFLYLFACRFRFSNFLQSIKNMFPAAIAGFGSMSSAAAMPLTIMGVDKNVTNPHLSRLVVPATVNIHLLGDCFAIPIFAFAVMQNFGVTELSFFSYLPFALLFVLAKFSVAAIPGGGIIVMLPILESQLGFNAEMSSLITALYILFDPVITCANVSGNGAFALLMDKLRFRKSLMN